MLPEKLRPPFNGLAGELKAIPPPVPFVCFVGLVVNPSELFGIMGCALLFTQAAGGFSWFTPAIGLILKHHSDLEPARWTTPPEPATDNGTTATLTLSPAPGNRFFRLAKP